ncbi:MAG: hypothetical protein Q8O94_03520 [bacterium]|nr:hypothetical protein [bacterium]
MSKEKGNLEDCIRKTIHHTGGSSRAILELFLMGGMSEQEAREAWKYRLELIRENLREATKRILEIRKAAESGDCKKVFELLNAKDLELGHNWPENSEKEAATM